MHTRREGECPKALGGCGGEKCFRGERGVGGGGWGGMTQEALEEESLYWRLTTMQVCQAGRDSVCKQGF